ncbi:MAG: DUF4962 domain-containing protein [Lentisphaeria bacterium]|nr:DUF4962 domain-containing protein [Lentisphaeria bacterium]
MRAWIVLATAGAAVRAYAAGETDTPQKWVTGKTFDKLAPHPRLFVSAAQIERVVDGRGEYFAKNYEQVEAAAETGLRDAEDPMAGISIWKKAVLIQGRLTALAIQWHRTKDRRYLEGALANVDAMKAWMKPNMITLAEGQCIAGLAVTYDLLYNDLTPEQRAWMVEIAREHFVKPFLRTTAPRDKAQRVEGESRSWWQDIISNWNPVSISGGGLLALAMYEDLPEAQTMIDRVNESYQPIFDYLEETDGGWVEGLGYWNWTVHYMSLFLTSYERATGQKHEGFRSRGFRDGLTFGTYFVPHGEACGFGDNQHGGFSHSLMAAAQQLGDTDMLARLRDHELRMQESAEVRKARQEATAGKEPEEKAAEDEGKPDELFNISYGGPQKLLISPDPLEQGLDPKADMIKYFPKQGWGMLADQWPKPAVYAAIRGGELGGAHTHEDLLSWHGVIGIERMIENISGGRESSAAFGARDKDIYERRSESKNTLFIGGLPPSRVRSGNPRAETTEFMLPGGPALRLDASKAFWLQRGNPRFVCRLFAVIDDKALLIVDRKIGSVRNPVEARAYTRKKATFSEKDVLLEGEFETARMTFAADQPAVLRRASAVLTSGRQEPPVMMRWQTLDSVRNVTMATLLSHGEKPVELEVRSDDERIVITAVGDGWDRTVTLSPRLELLEE